MNVVLHANYKLYRYLEKVSVKKFMNTNVLVINLKPITNNVGAFGFIEFQLFKTSLSIIYHINVKQKRYLNICVFVSLHAALISY